MLDNDVVQEEIALALADAGLVPGQVAVCIHKRDYAGEGKPAGHYRPGQTVYEEDDLGLAQDDVARLNDPATLDRHRIVAYSGYQPEAEEQLILAGLLRHELEHARQWERLGDAPFLLSRLIDEIHYARFTDVPEEKYLYRAKPDEQDANAAAAGHLLARWPDAQERLHTDAWYPLIWSYTRPEPSETLVSRSVCFLFQYSSLCELKAGEVAKSFAELLTEIDPSAADFWNMLTG